MKYVIIKTTVWLTSGQRMVSHTKTVTDNLNAEKRLVKEMFNADRVDFDYLTIEDELNNL